MRSLNKILGIPQEIWTSNNEMTLKNQKYLVNGCPLKVRFNIMNRFQTAMFHLFLQDWDIKLFCQLCAFLVQINTKKLPRSSQQHMIPCHCKHTLPSFLSLFSVCFGVFSVCNRLHYFSHHQNISHSKESTGQTPVAGAVYPVR